MLTPRLGLTDNLRIIDIDKSAQEESRIENKTITVLLKTPNPNKSKVAVSSNIGIG